MSKNLKKLASGIALVVILTSFVLAGCSSNLSQNSSSSSGQQTSASSEQQSIDQSTQQQPTSSSGQNQPPGASNMTAILNIAAEILGISSDDFIAAFNNAMPEGGASDSGQQGQQPPAPPSGVGQQGQAPAPPSDQQEGQQPPAPPSDQQQGQQPAPPPGQQMSQSQFMIEVYAKMAVELNISADDIAEAMTQAETELQQ